MTTTRASMARPIISLQSSRGPAGTRRRRRGCGSPWPKRSARPGAASPGLEGDRMKLRLLLCLGLAGLALMGTSPAARAEGEASQQADPWPREIQITGGTLTVYQPQVESWDGGFLRFRAAVSVKPSDGGQEVFGVIQGSAHTLVDRPARMVSLFDYSLLKIDFPSLPDHGERYYADLGRLLPSATMRISLDRLQGFLAVEKLTAQTVAVKNDPPQIIVSYRPAVLVPVSGAPVYRLIPNTGLDRVVNTRALIIS